MIHFDLNKIRNAENEIAVRAKIAAMREPYREMGERLHDVIMNSVIELHPKVWYGMPGYAKTVDGPVICYFRADTYMTFGLTENADFSHDKDLPHQLHEAAWFFSSLDYATEEKITSIVRNAVR